MTHPAGPIYLDTSALVTLYLDEQAGESLSRVLVGRRDLQLTELTITEFVSAIARRKREGALPGDACASIYRVLLTHVADEHYLKVGLAPETHRAAERLLLSLEATSLKAADALHLAAAVSAQARTVATLDSRMRLAASSLGLDLLPRGQP